MKLYYVLVAGTVVQPVHVLGDEGEVRYALLQFDERPVAGVRLCFADELAAPLIPFPDELRIAYKGFGGGELLGIVPRPG